jgi:hypothetical protein
MVINFINILVFFFTSEIVISFVIFIGVVAALLFVTIRGVDAYPFSHYPMFAGRHALKNIAVIRIALEKPGGELVWWQHEANRYPEFVGRQLKAIYKTAAVSDAKTNVALALRKQKLMLEVERLLTPENKKNYVAFHIIERTVNNTLTITDKTVETILFNK